MTDAPLTEQGHDRDLPGRSAWLENAVGLTTQRVVGVILVLTVLLVLVRPHDPNIDYETTWVLSGLLLGIGAAVAVTFLTRSGTILGLRRRGQSWPTAAVWALATTASLAGGVGGVLLALPLRYSYGWDARVTTGFSREVSADGALSAYAQDYLSRYPNNVPLIAFMNAARDLGGASDARMYVTYIAFNGLALAIVLLLCFSLVRMLRSTSAAFVAQAVVFVLVGCSPWMAVPYTDFPAMPFVVGAVALAVAGSQVRRPGRVRVVLVAAAFALAAVAFVIKSTPATTAAGFGLVGLVVLVAGSRPGRSRAAAVLVCGATAFGLTSMGSLAVADDVAHISRQQLDTSRTAPLTWWLANGLTTTRSISGRPYYGAYNPQMVNESMRLSGDALKSWSNRRLMQQVRSMGATGVAAFEVRKLGFNWGDGMFFAWGEGYDFQAKRLLDRDRVARGIQSWQHVSGTHYLVRASLTNGLWLAILLWAGAGLLRARYRRELLLVVVTVLGIAVFTMVFQGRSRYLFAYVPVVVSMAAAVNPLRPVRSPSTAPTAR